MSTTSLRDRPWLRDEPARTGTNLLCLPHAGAGASSFARWLGLFPPGIVPVRVQLPGREDAVAEAPLRRVSDAVGALLPRLAPLARTPLALYGHSMGALVTFELARALRAQGSPVVRLFVSGRRAPHLPARRPPVHRLADDALAAELAAAGAGAGVTAGGASFLRYALRLVRADLELSEQYRYQEGPGPGCPITVFHGTGDPIVEDDEARAWAEHTSAGFALHPFPGDHFFHQHHRAAIAAIVAQELA